MIKSSVILNNRLWNKYFKNPEKYIDNKIQLINKKDKNFRKNTLFFCLLLSDAKTITKLNKKFRKKNKSTDILSFPFYRKKELAKKIKEEKEIYLGDIIINLNKLKFKKNRKNFINEFNKLWVHGLTHLFGYKHEKNKDYDKMQKIEKKYLNFIS